MRLYFVFDVESIGLHGEPYAVGYTVLDEAWQEIDSAVFACNPDNASGEADDRDWALKNIPPIPVNCLTIEVMLDCFWAQWMQWKAKGALMYVECGWPVEAKFLAMCIGRNYPASKWDGPYPLHEIASFMEAAGMDPMAKYDRLPVELPVHDPLADARQSARMLSTALSKISQ